MSKNLKKLKHIIRHFFLLYMNYIHFDQKPCEIATLVPFGCCEKTMPIYGYNYYCKSYIGSMNSNSDLNSSHIIDDSRYRRLDNIGTVITFPILNRSRSCVSK